LNPPKKIKIGGHNYQVMFPYNFKERVDISGQADHDVQEIRVSEMDGAGVRRTESATGEIFWHEILHCIDHIYNADETSEEAMSKLSQGLYQVLTDNFVIKPKEQKDVSM